MATKSKKMPKRRNEFAMALAVGKFPNKVMASKREQQKSGYQKHKKEDLDVSEPRYDHIDPSKLKSPTDIALYEALVRHVDEKERRK